MGNHPRKAAATALPWVAACALMVVVAGCATLRRSVPAPPPEPMEDEVQTGQASWYGEPYHGRRTASGEIYDMHQLTAAHPHDLPPRATDDPEQSCGLKREALGNGSHEVSPLSAGV